MDRNKCETCFVTMLCDACKLNDRQKQNTVCKYCGGALAEREYKGKTYYYCYSCHMEFERG